MRSIVGSASILFVVATLAMSISACGHGQQATYPSKPIEYVVHSNPGSTTDTLGRMIADIVDKKRLCTQPLVVVNKSGGSGAIAMQYMLEKKGDPYSVLATATAILVTTTKKNLAQIPDFTPVALLQTEPVVLVTRVDSPYNNLNDVLQAAKAKPKDVSVGMGSIGSSDHILLFKMQEVTGAELNLVSFQTGGEGITQALGGHVDLCTQQPLDVKAQVDAKKLKVLACFTSKRLELFPSVPTAKEQGVDLTADVFRGIIGPPNMPKEAVQYLENLFKKVTETPEWTAQVKESGVESNYLSSAEWGKVLQQYSVELSRVVKEMGLKD